MKKLSGLVVLVAVIAGGGFLAAQSSSAPQKWIEYGPSTRIIANSLRYDEEQRTVFARGAVRIVSESSTTTADEADVHILRSSRSATDLDIVLRGNVRVLVTPQNGVVR